MKMGPVLYKVVTVLTGEYDVQYNMIVEEVERIQILIKTILKAEYMLKYSRGH